MVGLPAPSPLEVGVREARARFSNYLEQARVGTPVVIRTQDKPAVEMRLLEPPAAQPRQPGWLIGTELEHFELPEWTEEELQQLFYKPLDW